MANSKKEGEGMDLDDKNRVVITPEDAQECAKFFQFFEIPVPKELADAFELFQKDANLMNQEELKFQLSEMIAHSPHPVFADEVFAQVRPETREVNEELQFTRQLEKELTSNRDE